MDEQLASIGETVEALRSELSRALERAPRQGIGFHVTEAAVELEIAVIRDAGLEGGVRLGVVSVGAKASTVHQRTHRVTLQMEPKLLSPDADPQSVVIAGNAGEVE
ncbi:trypco2 family protein [Agromyces sp. NPDC056523]|uniref:trypco2 family protein n=1 Tax=Agromyces sp. NPDC056523 TaxID=3345850 RepID=UPI00366B5FED